uniref:Uncharacterized protein n=1 Tax=Glossina palpalis gambiensis TaxID=67801 RepID=A0A1B0AUE0_9MUSC
MVLRFWRNGIRLKKLFLATSSMFLWISKPNPMSITYTLILMFTIIITITGLSFFVGKFRFVRFDYLMYPCIALHVPANTTHLVLSLLLTHPFRHNVAFAELGELIHNICVSQKYATLCELLLHFPFDSKSKRI